MDYTSVSTQCVYVDEKEFEANVRQFTKKRDCLFKQMGYNSLVKLEECKSVIEDFNQAGFPLYPRKPNDLNLFCPY